MGKVPEKYRGEIGKQLGRNREIIEGKHPGKFGGGEGGGKVPRIPTFEFGFVDIRQIQSAVARLMSLLFY